MNIHRLIDRIEKVLREGATDPVIHSLAKEYARYRTIIDQRLDQCVTLIHSGNKFAALELAEEAPNVLDLMENLSFGGDAQWKEMCEEKSVYLGPNFTQDHVDMIEGLYGEKISEDHPVFREYRTAMRSRDEDRTFKILKTIIRMEPDHEAAKRHFGQLSVKILENRLDQIDLLIREGRKDELLGLMDEVESTDWVIPPEKTAKANLWENALAVRQTYRRADAKTRCEEILVELASLRAAEDWKEAMSIIGEFYELSLEHQLENEHEADDIHAYNELKAWAEERMEEDRDVRSQQALIARFTERITQMKQAEQAGGLTMENYLEFQAEINAFRKEFEGLSRSDVPPEVLMDLQKGSRWAKGRVSKMRSRTKKIWIITTALTVCLVIGFLYAFNTFERRDGKFVTKQYSQLLDDVANQTSENEDPFKQWDFLENFANPDAADSDTEKAKAEFQLKKFQEGDEELDKELRNLVDKTFVNASALEEDTEKERFLLKVQGKELKVEETPIVKADVLEQGRVNVLEALCKSYLDTPTPDSKELKRFVEKLKEFTSRFNEEGAAVFKRREELRQLVTELRPSYERSDDESMFHEQNQGEVKKLGELLSELDDLGYPAKIEKIGDLMVEKPLPPILESVFPYHNYSQNSKIRKVLKEIDSELSDAEDRLKGLQQEAALVVGQYEQLNQEIDDLKQRIVDAGARVKKDPTDVDDSILQETDRVKQLKLRLDRMKKDLDKAQQVALETKLLKVGNLLATYRYLVKGSSKKKIETRIVAAEKVADALESGKSTDVQADLADLAEKIQELAKFKKETDEAKKPDFLQTRRIDELDDRRAAIIQKMGQGTKARSDLIQAATLEEYLGALEAVQKTKAFKGDSENSVKDVLSKRDLFDTQGDKLHLQLLFQGPPEIWDKIKAGKLGVLPKNSQPEFDLFSALLSVSDIRDIWRYKLYNCTVGRAAGVNGAITFNTKKQFVDHVLCIGRVIENKELAGEPFDKDGNPVSNRAESVKQIGVFIIDGQNSNKEYTTLRFGGGIQGELLDEPDLTNESRFVRDQIERRMDGDKKIVSSPLLDLVDALIQDRQVSPLFKAYMHDKISQIILRRPDEWGVSLASNFKQDHQQLKAKLTVPLKEDDWMIPGSYEALQGSLALFYKNLANRSYSQQAKFSLGFLQELTTVTFPFAGYVDEKGNPRFRNPSNPPALTWGIGKTPQGQLVLQRFKGSNLLPFSPLLTIDKDVQAIFQKALLGAGATDPNRFGTLDNMIPFRYRD